MNHKHGFTLIEVMIAIFILVSSIYVLTDLQIRSLFRVLKDREEVDRVFLVKKDSYTSYITPPKGDKPHITKIEDPAVDIKTEYVELNKKSVFYEHKDLISLIKTTGTWKQNNVMRNIIMITLVEKQQTEKQQK